jgi:hypothetical protein
VSNVGGDAAGAAFDGAEEGGGDVEAGKGDWSTVRSLLSKGADVNARDSIGHTALMWAAWQGDTPTAKALLDKGADVNVRDTDGNR